MAGKFHIDIFRSTSPFDVLLPIAGVMLHFVTGAFDMVSLLNSKTIENELGYI